MEWNLAKSWLLLFQLSLLITSDKLIVSAAVEGSGLPDVSSGSGDTQGGDEGDLVIDTGSGSIPEVARSTVQPTTLDPDTEGGDVPDIIYIDGSGDVPGSDKTTVMFSGDGETTTTALMLPPYTQCSDKYVWCWCVNEEGLEVPGSRYFYNSSNIDLRTWLSITMDCRALLDSLPRSTTTKATTMATGAAHDNVEVTETEVPIVVATLKNTPPPYKVQTDFSTNKFEKPADVTDPLDSVGNDGIFRDDVIIRETERPLFSHPGILAAVIGGGVVALLCALLLIMFVVYRMRKKDEGSYPLDPDQKPRLHTYTRAPINNKEFYA